jgi:ElaB/YqjD/DUF883 family membrane-anchored ribosome-binding protein
MADEPEVIRKQMEETRTDLTEKLETLEEEIVDKVENATEKVSETVEHVTETVKETVDTVKETVHETVETVKSTFDIAHQVDRHPWLMFGGAVALGYVGGRVFASLEVPRTPAWCSGSETFAPAFQTTAVENGSAAKKSAPTSQWLGDMAEKFRPEINALKELAVGAALSVARDLLTRSLPEHARQPVADTVDRVTTKLGGKPVQGLVPVAEPDRQPQPKGYAAPGACDM